MKSRYLAGAAVAALVVTSVPALAQDIKVGLLVDFTGPTSDVGKVYGQGVADAMNHINKTGGVAGKKLDFEMVDYSYKAPDAIATYKKWVDAKVTAIQGWGTADTEALVQSVAKDQIPYYSASYSGHLTDPTGKGPRDRRPPRTTSSTARPIRTPAGRWCSGRPATQRRRALLSRSLFTWATTIPIRTRRRRPAPTTPRNWASRSRIRSNTR